MTKNNTRNQMMKRKAARWRAAFWLCSAEERAAILADIDKGPPPKRAKARKVDPDQVDILDFLA